MPRLAALLAVVTLLARSTGELAAADQPNVLFLICDDLNCDLACYGHPLVQSPNIDRLAKRGVQFLSAHCQYPLCGPSRASMMTGLYPDQTLIQGNAIYVRERVPNVVTLPQHFRNNGYFATRIGKIYHYNVPAHIGTSGHDDPFSWNQTFNPRGRDVDDEPLITTLRPGQFGGTLSWLAADGADEEQTDAIGAAKAVELLKLFASDAKPSRQPFYLAVGLYRPHTPYVAPKKYFDLYPREKINVPTVPDGYLDTLPAPARDTLTRKKDQVNLPAETAKQAIQAYYASITFADAQVGKILEALEQTGLDKNTVILFTSDHGYHMGEHGYYQKTTLFHNATHVPLIIAGPGIPGGQKSPSLAEQVDFYPTLCELCGLTAPNFISGKSLFPVLSDPSQQVRTASLTQFENGYSLVTENYRYTEWGPEAAQGNELYDRQADPAELKNIVGDEKHAATVRELSKLLRERIAEATRAPEGVQQIRPEARRRNPAR